MLSMFLHSSNIQSRSLILKLFCSIIRDKEQPIADETGKFDITYDYDYDLLNSYRNSNAHIKIICDKLGSYVVKFVANVVDKEQKITTATINFDYVINLVTLIAHIAEQNSECLIDEPKVVRFIFNIFADFHHKSLIAVKCKKILVQFGMDLQKSGSQQRVDAFFEVIQTLKSFN